MRLGKSFIPFALLVMSGAAFFAVNSYLWFISGRDHLFVATIPALYLFWAAIYYKFGCKAITNCKSLLVAQARWVILVALFGSCWLLDVDLAKLPFGLAETIISMWALNSAIEALVLLNFSKKHT